MGRAGRDGLVAMGKVTEVSGGVTLSDLEEWVRAYARTLSDNKDYLTKLDSQIGDADHGVNMDRGFSAVVAKLDAAPPSDIGDLFKTVGMTLISTVGGASGPLYGTLFVRASSTAGSVQELGPADYVTCLEAGLEGIVKLGKAESGDKTMVDTLRPALVEMRTQTMNGASLADAIKATVPIAEAAMKSTIPMLARKGRASYLGERSVGHQDPGATSAYLLLSSALAAFSPA